MVFEKAWLCNVPSLCKIGGSYRRDKPVAIYL